MSIAEKLTHIAENEQKVYDAGKKEQYDEFWNEYQENGDRTEYTNAFSNAYWNDNTFKPKYNIVVGRGYQTFLNSKITNLAEMLREQGITMTIPNNCASLYQMFMGSSITHLPKISTPSGGFKVTNTFLNCADLIEIEELNLKVNNFFDDTFGGCVSLERMNVTGTISSTFKVGDCEKLTRESLLSIIKALYNFSNSSTTHTCTLGATNLAKLTAAEKAVATGKGWTLA